jgi:hypothetical protein
VFRSGAWSTEEDKAFRVAFFERHGRDFNAICEEMGWTRSLSTVQSRAQKMLKKMFHEGVPVGEALARTGEGHTCSGAPFDADSELAKNGVSKDAPTVLNEKSTASPSLRGGKARGDVRYWFALEELPKPTGEDVHLIPATHIDPASFSTKKHVCLGCGFLSKSEGGIANHKYRSRQRSAPGTGCGDAHWINVEAVANFNDVQLIMSSDDIRSNVLKVMQGIRTDPEVSSLTTPTASQQSDAASSSSSSASSSSSSAAAAPRNSASLSTAQADDAVRETRPAPAGGKVTGKGGRRGGGAKLGDEKVYECSKCGFASISVKGIENHVYRTERGKYKDGRASCKGGIANMIPVERREAATRAAAEAMTKTVRAARSPIGERKDKATETVAPPSPPKKVVTRGSPKKAVKAVPKPAPKTAVKAEAKASGSKGRAVAAAPTKATEARRGTRSSPRASAPAPSRANTRIVTSPSAAMDDVSDDLESSLSGSATESDDDSAVNLKQSRKRPPPSSATRSTATTPRSDPAKRTRSSDTSVATSPTPTPPPYIFAMGVGEPAQIPIESSSVPGYFPSTTRVGVSFNRSRTILLTVPESLSPQQLAQACPRIFDRFPALAPALRPQSGVLESLEPRFFLVGHGVDIPLVGPAPMLARSLDAAADAVVWLIATNVPARGELALAVVNSFDEATRRVDLGSLCLRAGSVVSVVPGTPLSVTWSGILDVDIMFVDETDAE